MTGGVAASDAVFWVFVVVSLLVLTYAVAEPHGWGYLLRDVGERMHEILQGMARGLPRPIPL